MYRSQIYINDIFFDYNNTRSYPLQLSCGDEWIGFKKDYVIRIYNTIFNFIKKKHMDDSAFINGVNFKYEDYVLRIYFIDGGFSFGYMTTKIDILPFLLNCLMEYDVISSIID